MARLLGLTLCAALALGCAGAGAKSPADQSFELPSEAKRLPARLRRLTNLEIERSVSALVRAHEALSLELPPDVRRDGYTPNADQDVPAAWAVRYSALVRELSERAAKERAAELGSVGELGRRAWRRPLSEQEKTSLKAALREGGFSLVLRVLLESPSFLYVSELGSAPA